MEEIKEIELRNITKKFPGVTANKNINLTFRAGEVHALLGENGAGKSTLMNILYGKYSQDEGDIFVNGKKNTLTSPADAISLGIGMVHQHFMLFPSMTVTENIILNYPPGKESFLDLKKAREEIRQISSDFGLEIDPDGYVWQLSVGEQQRIEILKVLYRKASFLIMDEPTAVLTPQEAKNLFKTFRRLLDNQYGIVFISHKLQEVMDISDVITILRNGEVAGFTRKEDTDKEKLAAMMVGRDVIELKKKDAEAGGEAVLEIKNLYVENDKNLTALCNLSLKLRRGEILGLAGVSGNGQRELAEAITGLRKVKKGKIFLKDTDITGASPSFIISQGVSFIPEERMVMGVIKDFPLFENAILKNHGFFPYSTWTFLIFSAIKSFTEELIKAFSIKASSVDIPVKNLSGGNIQKLILARELSAKPCLLIAAQPSRGVDIGATAFIRKRLLEMREDGTAIILISEDLDEIVALSDRIAVIYNGRIVDTVSPDTSIEHIGLMMGGGKPEENNQGR